MNKQSLLSNFYIALEAVLANQLRSLLTALGIIFGVAAVIAMLAIGNGAQKEILEQIELVGVNNIIIQPVVEQTEQRIGESDENDKKKFSPGLKLLDVESIRNNIPGVERLSPEILLETYIIKNGIRRSSKLVGVEPSYFEVANFELDGGEVFNENQLRVGAPVCIIGKGIQSKFFPQENPIGQKIKVGTQWLEVIGVLKERFISEKAISNLGIRDYNMDVYTPIQTVLVRYINRDLVTGSGLKKSFGGMSMMSFGRGMSISISGASSDSEDSAPKNYHQIDRLVVQVSESAKLSSTAEVLSRMLERRHFGVIDYEITIPELLLKQQQRTQNIFNIVLAAIAAISLLVGGIGIMNIMLASVMERIKEIGLRLSIGAKSTDIVSQFLFEAVLISVTGGIIGVILGIALAFAVSSLADFPTEISFASIAISFGVAATVGLIFGITPARRAASQDPITSLRHE
ncbi:membrane protein [Roseivirga seohaensis subsp. aquiponti]|uniref:Membrane protein n=1 Tax=Roseivirga seohaensis subsp. aquiponti TaxID=1566026 RepID=A0A0L8AJV5_9BACT|nr:ABC transporter permease [Roseivirga seohaensis]KOF02718.1 membrane protein [Roseivirga seohaensis subsp. aquiponti]